MAPYTTPFTFNIDDVFIPSFDIDKTNTRKIGELNKKLRNIRIWTGF
jgi:aminoglycoside N3'-acetyltransferase